MFHRIFLRDEYRLAGVPLQSWECVVDLGANVGLFSSRVSELACKVFSYEPFQGNREQLEKNLKTRENITVIHKAVGQISWSIQSQRQWISTTSMAYISLSR